MTQLGAQCLGIAAVAGWSALATFLLVKLIGSIVKLRVEAEQEYEGLDLATHGEHAYDHS